MEKYKLIFIISVLAAFVAFMLALYAFGWSISHPSMEDNKSCILAVYDMATQKVFSDVVYCVKVTPLNSLEVNDE